MKKTMLIVMVGILLLSVFTVFLSVDICGASGNTIYVDDSNTAGPWDGTQEHPYQHIQDAINAAEDSGDTIYVYSGNYSENVEINKILTITGENKASTIISGATEGDVVTINANYVNISGFTIQNAVGTGYACIVTNEVQNCKITNNIIKNSYDGIYLLGSNDNSLIGNTIRDNDGNGIFAYYSSNNIFQNNLINFNQYGISIETNSNNNQIFNNDIRGKQVSIPLGTGVNLGTSTSGNIVYHNYFNDFARNQNAIDLSTGNIWYMSSAHEGNYWDDYTGKDQYHGPNQDIPDSDGIGDTPYNITTDGSVQDIYPLGYFQGVQPPPSNTAPTADAGGPYSGQINSEITFDGSRSSDVDGTVVGYRWDWTNDGTYDTSWLSAATTTHSYSNIGSYTVKLQVKDDDGATDYDTAQVTITESSQKPIAIVTISPNPATYGETVSFQGQGTDDGNITAYEWSEGDTILSPLQSFNKSDFSVGTHVIYFKVKDNSDMWSDNVPTTLVINQGSSPSDGSPTADADGPYLGYANAPISFNGSGSTDDGTIVYYKWDFGDGTTIIEKSPTHIYTETKNYTVTLTVTDDGGKTDTDTTYANVSTQPSGNDGEKTPGFETIFVIISVALIVLWRKHKL